MITKRLANRIFDVLVHFLAAGEHCRQRFLDDLVAINTNQPYELANIFGWPFLLVANDAGMLIGIEPSDGAYSLRVNDANNALLRLWQKNTDFFLLDRETADKIYTIMVDVFEVEGGRREEFVDQVVSRPTREYTPPMMPFGANFYNYPGKLRFSCHSEASTSVREIQVDSANQKIEALVRAILKKDCDLEVQLLTHA